jgi:LPXTG-motif cell wall-anchored protein
MPTYTTIISRALPAALAATALAVPAAIAKPIDLRSPDARDAAIHRPAVDLRSPDARDAAEGRTDTTIRTSSLAGTTSGSRQDLRNPDSRDAPSPLPGPPTWPAHPQVIRATHAAPDTGDDGTPWTLLAIGIAGIAGVAGGGIVARSRRRSRVAV